MPDSGLWVDRITANTAATELTPAGEVASTPVGVAMVPTAAKSLGWPKKTYSWIDLAGATRKSMLGAILLFTAQGVPMLYAGQEFGANTPKTIDENKLPWNYLESDAGR